MRRGGFTVTRCEYVRVPIPYLVLHPLGDDRGVAAFFSLSSIVLREREKETMKSLTQIH